MKLKAVEERYILIPFVEEKKEENLIIRPDSTKKKVNDVGIVVDGPKYSDFPNGTKVLFDVYDVKRAVFEGQEYIFANIESIFATVDDSISSECEGSC